MFIIIGRGFERWFIDTMYHAVKQFLNFGRLRQLIVIVWAANSVSKCKMKETVIELVRKLGAPKEINV